MDYMQDVPYKVTAAITTYKRSWERIEKAFRSIEAQEYPIHEILVIDDNPQPSPYSMQIREKVMESPNARYISMEGNYGVGAARNRAIKEATGELIAFLDDDDAWLPTKTTTLVGLFLTDPNRNDPNNAIALAFGQGEKVWDTGETEWPWSRTVYKEYPSFHDMLWGDRVGSASHPLIRLTVIRALGGFREDKMKAVEDYEMWIRIAQKRPIRGTDEVVYTKHMDEGEHVSTSPRVFAGYIRIYEEFENWYNEDKKAKTMILRNIVRVGIKGKNIKVIPWIPRWIKAMILEKF